MNREKQAKVIIHPASKHLLMGHDPTKTIERYEPQFSNVPIERDVRDWYRDRYGKRTDGVMEGGELNRFETAIARLFGIKVKGRWRDEG
jgi:hypothetical protein